MVYWSIVCVQLQSIFPPFWPTPKQPPACSAESHLETSSFLIPCHNKVVGIWHLPSCFAAISNPNCSEFQSLQSSTTNKKTSWQKRLFNLFFLTTHKLFLCYIYGPSSTFINHFWKPKPSNASRSFSRDKPKPLELGQLCPWGNSIDSLEISMGKMMENGERCCKSKVQWNWLFQENLRTRKVHINYHC